MSVQVAAYGIDLSSASRVYFVSPIWQTAMEQQAIKRAHRIGQTKPVYVETIVIRSSIEENMLKRRAMLAIKAEKHHGASNQHHVTTSSTKEFYNDRKMQEILNHAAFVPLPQNASEVYIGDDLFVRQPINPFIEPVPLIKADNKDDTQLNKGDQVIAPSEGTEAISTYTPLVDQTHAPRAKRPKVSFQLP